jgi:hypothetical protein
MLIGACVAVAGATAAVASPRPRDGHPDEARKKLDADKGAWRPRSAAPKSCRPTWTSWRRAPAHQRTAGRHRALIQQSEGQLNLMKSRLGDLEAQEKQVRGSLAQRQGSISALLAAMQRMGRNPPPVMVTRREGRAVDGAQRHAAGGCVPRAEGQALGLPSSSTIWCA